jgi:chromate transporter
VVETPVERSFAPQPPRATLPELARLFLRLGLTAFGGPAAHIALMENEVVRRRRWLSAEQFLDLLGASNLIPGPSSTELAIFIGYERAGALGLVVAGACFILPAALIVGALAWAYVRFGGLPPIEGVLYGVKPVVIAIVVQALWGLAPKATRKSIWLGVLGVAACAAFAVGVDALVVLLCAGVAAVAARGFANGDGATHAKRFAPLPLAGAAATGLAPASVAGIFFVFLKVGAVVFGSGYVLLAFLRADLVDRLHWLSETQLLDAVAVGQVTPGPVFTTATFIGYVVAARAGTAAGIAGAVAATVGIFLPGFALVAAARPVVARLRRSPVSGAFLDGVNVASLGLMAAVAAQLGRAAIVDTPTALVAVGSALALLRFRINATWLVAGGAAVGVVARVFFAK